MEQLLKSVLQSMAKNKTANRLAKRYGIRFGAQRFVAGETVESAIQTIRELNQQGMAVTLDRLGEFVSEPEEARLAAEFGVYTLKAIHDSGVKASLSLKLTQMGLDIDKKLCLENMRRILSVAKQYGFMVTIDMEDYGHCQVTLDVFDELRKTYENAGVVIQACLYRSLEDVKRLAQEGVHVRIVKGAYLESAEVADPDKAHVDANYIQLMETQLQSKGFTAIATHDSVIIEYAKRYIEKHSIPKNKYEFQMLYGIAPNLKTDLVNEGYPLRIYVPYGNDWYGYFMRRLAERPANVEFAVRGLFK